MGLEDKRFSGDVDDDFRCPICRDIVEDPITSQCEHVFCKLCINQWLQKETSCPVDRKSLNSSQLCEPARYFRNIYLKLVMKCAFESNGCKESFKIEDSNSHQNKCKFNPIVKSECEKGCEALLNGNELISHNCVQYLKSINLKYDKDLEKMYETQSEQSDLLTKFEKELALKCDEINILKNTIESQNKEIENAKKRESEQHEFVRLFELMLSSQSEIFESMQSLQVKSIAEYKEKLRNSSLINVSNCLTAKDHEDEFEGHIINLDTKDEDKNEDKFEGHVIYLDLKDEDEIELFD